MPRSRAEGLGLVAVHKTSAAPTAEGEDGTIGIIGDKLRENLEAATFQLLTSKSAAFTAAFGET